jgi:hypothetical protein
MGSSSIPAEFLPLVPATEEALGFLLVFLFMSWAQNLSSFCTCFPGGIKSILVTLTRTSWHDKKTAGSETQEVTDLLTSLRLVALFETLIVSQLAKKFPYFHETKYFFTVFARSRN